MQKLLPLLAMLLVLPLVLVCGVAGVLDRRNRGDG